MAEPGSDYVYSSLPDSQYIRLIELLPTDDSIACVLHVHALREAPAYYAISYCWGDQKDRLPINIRDGSSGFRQDQSAGKLSITRNLYDALNQLRLDGKAHFLWADAVCINQADKSERSAQVAFMRTIYERADVMLTWCGLADDSTGPALRFASLAYQHRPTFEQGITGGASDQVYGLSKLLGLERVPVLDEEGLHAAKKLFDKTELFSRIWVVQELTTGREVIGMIGSHRVEWDRLGFAALWILASSSSVTRDQASITCVANAVNIWQRQFVSRTNAADLLYNSRFLLASDPRDKVYALLGFPSLLNDVPIAPDYNKTVQELYKDVVRENIKRTGSLRILAYIDHPPPLPAIAAASPDTLHLYDGFPSWVPCWHDNTNTTTSEEEQYVVFARLADMPQATTQPLAGTFSGGLRMDDTLTLNGLPLDRVAAVSDSLQFADYPELPWIQNVDAITGFWYVIVAAAASKNDPRLYRLAKDLPLTGGVGLDYLPVSRSANSRESYRRSLMLALAYSFIEASLTALKSDSSLCPRRDLKTDMMTPAAKAEAHHYLRIARLACRNRRLFLTDNDHVALGPSQIRKGDLIALLFGGYNAFILRRVKDKTFQLVGGAVINDLMADGLKAWKSGRLEEVVFDLI